MFRVSAYTTNLFTTDELRVPVTVSIGNIVLPADNATSAPFEDFEPGAFYVRRFETVDYVMLELPRYGDIGVHVTAESTQNMLLGVKLSCAAVPLPEKSSFSVVSVKNSAIVYRNPGQKTNIRFVAQETLDTAMRFVDLGELIVTLQILRRHKQTPAENLEDPSTVTVEALSEPHTLCFRVVKRIGHYRRTVSMPLDVIDETSQKQENQSDKGVDGSSKNTHEMTTAGQLGETASETYKGNFIVGGDDF